MSVAVKIVLPIVVLLAGYGYARSDARETAPASQPESVYVLPRLFFVELTDRREAMITAAVVSEDAEAVARNDAALYDAIEAVLVRSDAGDLLTTRGRRRLRKALVKGIRSSTPVQVSDVRLPDVTVD